MQERKTTADPSGMTTKKTTTTADAIRLRSGQALRDDNKKVTGNDPAPDELYWMVRVTVAVWMVEPPVAVTVTA